MGPKLVKCKALGPNTEYMGPKTSKNTEYYGPNKEKKDGRLMPSVFLAPQVGLEPTTP